MPHVHFLQAVRLEELTAGLEGRGLLDDVDLDLDLGDDDDELAGALAELAPPRRCRSRCARPARPALLCIGMVPCLLLSSARWYPLLHR
jgi:hypothetical protein